MIELLNIEPAKPEALALAAVIAWGIIEIIKPALRLYNIEPKSPKHTLIIRAAALVVGAMVGAPLYPALTSGAEVWTGSNILIGAMLGGSAGALNALLVAQIKRKLRGRQ